MSQDIHINQVIDHILKEADLRTLQAGQSGEYGDRGATDLRTAVEYYRYGFQGVLPPAWRKYADQVAAENDPEHAEYLRLKAKFERK
ncbi:hypothetical protein F0P96_10485 [Hymenobacter busanensis]|uniref:Uncharacterized protein n=1 Tax=Hymenobacter busanensis TaxID=2607656 RepID=A0A7L4ZYB9_9BACT|nr:hypothetical protein [Hymenobacter busanensis]KAA9333387.1 hypothetical protein F0P96_10485 [Hymenobacter busanensis]QHJ07933.1 hypothetical protein GUY19_11820 [Hymenobacter busanensis]